MMHFGAGRSVGQSVGRSVGHRALIAQHLVTQRNTIAVESIMTRHCIHRITHKMS
jgi:hypothetical protein